MSARVIASGLTADRTFAFPDANGTIVVTGSSPSFTTVTLGDGLVATPSLTFATEPTLGLYRIGGATLGVAIGGSKIIEIGASYLAVRQDSGQIMLGASVDTVLTRDAANTLAQRNGTNGQMLRVYNTYTDASNYERLEIGWSANNASILGNASGTGASRTLQIGTGSGSSGRLAMVIAGTERWNLQSGNGHLLASTDNTVDIGASGATRPRDYYGAGKITSAGATSGIGYATGAGGAVTQLTSRTTTVILNTVSGDITLFSAAGSATAASFTVTNSAVVATDNIVINQKSGTNLYNTIVTAVGAGSFVVTFYTTGGTATDAPVFHFSVIKGVNA